jgi:hypothetical protein
MRSWAGRPDQGSGVGHLGRHGADVRYRRPAAHPDALLHRAERQGSRKSVGWATTWIGYFYILTFIIGFGASSC